MEVEVVNDGVDELEEFEEEENEDDERLVLDDVSFESFPGIKWAGILPSG